MLTGLDKDSLAAKFSGDDKINQSFAWLGCFSEEPVDGDSPINAFCNLLCFLHFIHGILGKKS